MLIFMLFRHWQALNLHKTLACNGLDFRYEFVVSVESFDIVPSTYTDSIHQNVGHSTTTCNFAQKLLKMRAELVFVEFDNVGSWHDVVLAQD